MFAFDPRGQEETIRLVNQQLQDVLAPQLKGKQIVSFSEAEPGWGKYIGTTNFLDRRFYYSQEHMSRIRGVNGVCETFIANGKLTFGPSQRLKPLAQPDDLLDSAQPYSTRFYQDFLIPRGEFPKRDQGWESPDLSKVVFDESELNAGGAGEYKKEAAERFNDFFGTSYRPDSGWYHDFNGQYAIVFSLEDRYQVEENLAALAELDSAEGLSVTGIYYDLGGSNERPLLCKPMRPDDPINTSTLDPRESLRLLAAHQDIADMLLSSELYGISEKFDFAGILESFENLDHAGSALPIGACVVVDEGRFLTPEMVEAISKVCYRCIDVKLLAAV